MSSVEFGPRSTISIATALAGNARKPAGGRAGLLASSALAGGTLRGLALATGVVAAVGVSPALAQCFSGTGGVLNTAACEHAAATGANSTAVGLNANATGTSAT